MGTVFITGANRGLGLEFVKEFTEKKFLIFVQLVLKCVLITHYPTP